MAVVLVVMQELVELVVVEQDQVLELAQQVLLTQAVAEAVETMQVMAVQVALE